MLPQELAPPTPRLQVRLSDRQQRKPPTPHPRADNSSIFFRMGKWHLIREQPQISCPAQGFYLEKNVTKKLPETSHSACPTSSLLVHPALTISVP